jgi:hypothetical protein
MRANDNQKAGEWVKRSEPKQEPAQDKTKIINPFLAKAQKEIGVSPRTKWSKLAQEWEDARRKKKNSMSDMVDDDAKAKKAPAVATEEENKPNEAKEPDTQELLKAQTVGKTAEASKTEGKTDA